MTKNITNKKPGEYLYSQTEPFKLVSGRELTHLDLSYETYGNLNSNNDNVILLHHSLSMSAHAANPKNTEVVKFAYNNQQGWWQNMIGPNLALDTNKYYIICINNLGSCFGSTGPSNYNGKFPTITMHDIINSQKLLLDYLGIKKLKMVIGGSIGGMLSLAWLQMYPETVEKLFVVACSLKSYSSNMFNRMIQQEVMDLAKDNKQLGLKIARMIAYYNYRSTDELNKRFNSLDREITLKQDFAQHPVYKTSDLYSYYSYNADKFVDNFDPDSYRCMLNAMDLYDLTQSSSYHPAGFPNINPGTQITITGIVSDVLCPLYQQQAIFDLLSFSGYSPNFIEHQSTYGHDAFFVDHQEFTQYINNLFEC